MCVLHLLVSGLILTLSCLFLRLIVRDGLARKGELPQFLLEPLLDLEGRECQDESRQV